MFVYKCNDFLPNFIVVAATAIFSIDGLHFKLCNEVKHTKTRFTVNKFLFIGSSLMRNFVGSFLYFPRRIAPSGLIADV